ncbi:MAG: IS701 family transposase [Planctomycetota bacterium]
MVVLKAGPEPLDDLAGFLEPFSSLVRRAESRHALERYTTGLLSDLRRKTASDIGRAVAGTNSQCLQEFLTRTDWDSKAMDRLRVRHMLEQATVSEGVQIIDDTGFAKKGAHSVGVDRQYLGTLGRIDNGQVLVTSHYVDWVFDWPIMGRLYLPKSWATDQARREKVKIPEEIAFRTKGQIALELIDEGLHTGIPTRAIVADAGYGDQPSLLDGLQDRKLPYLVGVASTVRFRLADTVEQDPGDGPPPAYLGLGRPPRALRMQDRIPAEGTATILAALPEEGWKSVAWREGTKGALAKEFVRVPVYRTGSRGAHVPCKGWLVGERPLPGRRGDSKYYFAWGLDSLALEELVDLAHLRWVIERFYQDAKGELGLDDYEGRLWTGFHRHVALVMLAHSYLTLQQTYGPEVTGQEETKRAHSGEQQHTSPPRKRAFPPTGPEEPGRTKKGGHR